MISLFVVDEFCGVGVLSDAFEHFIRLTLLALMCIHWKTVAAPGNLRGVIEDFRCIYTFCFLVANVAGDYLQPTHP